ncbi:MAG: carboxypeptidase-like regulatory domain-containing protein, partial [Elusimicrobiota bacterium]
IEVFNPTTYTWTMNGNIGLKFRRATDLSDKTIQINYLNSSLPSNSYYLFANTGTVVAGSEIVDADAVWAAGNPTSDFPYFATQSNIIPIDSDGGDEGGGGVKLYKVSNGAVIDQVGWSSVFHAAPFSETAPVIETSTGLSRNEVYARFASTDGINPGYGPAYDSNDNSVDFYDYSIVNGPPHGSFSGTKVVISGTPAVGAVVSCTDGLSSSDIAISSGNPPYAFFSLVDVATGSWTVLITSGAYSLEKSSVSIPDPGGSVYTLDSAATFLTQDNNTGMIAGRIINVFGAPLNGMKVTSGGANSTNTNTDGRYRLRVSPGTVDITANPAVGGNAAYVTVSSQTISVAAGEVHAGVDFTLYQGGRISGSVTRDGSAGLPGVAVSILDANSIAKDQQVTGSDGSFLSVVLSTGYYIAQPTVGMLETVTPISSTVTIVGMGTTYFSSTFTVSGALGYITGTVKSGGLPIKTGVLIVVTTATLSGTPPAPPDLSTATLTGSPYYLVSSMENGIYTAEVRNGALYNVYSYYPKAGSSSAVILSSKTTGVSVTAGQTTSGVNFSW